MPPEDGRQISRTDQCSAGPFEPERCHHHYRRPGSTANLPEETGRGREETADRRRWRLSCLAPYRGPYRLPCVDAYRLETIGGEFALKPRCERPRLEHHQYSIRRVLPDHFGTEFWVRQALAAANPLAVLPLPEIAVSFNDTSHLAYWSMAVLRNARC